MKLKILLSFIIIIGSTGSWLTGVKLAVLPEVSKPDFIVIDDRQLLIADKTFQLHLYSMKNFKYEKQIFKRGEGPGEASGIAYVWTSPEYIFVYCMGKNLYFTREGKFLKEFKTPIARTSFIRPVGNKFLCMNHSRKSPTEGSAYDYSFYTHSADKKMKYEKLLYYWENLPIRWKGSRRPLTLIKPEHNVCVFENRIFICDSDRGLFVQVHNLNGDRLYQVRLESEKIKVPDDYAAEFFGTLKNSGKTNSFNSQFYYDEPEFFPAFFRFYVGKNKLYFLTYQKNGNNREVIICDWQGKNIKKTYIPWVNYWDARMYTIWNDKFYWLVDNEETEEWELHATDVK